MKNEQESDSEVSSSIDRDSKYWERQFAGTPFSIVVPPYIRFLQDLLLLHRAVRVLRTARKTAIQGSGDLHAAIIEFDEGREAKILNLNYERYFSSQLVVSLVSGVESFFSSAVSAALRLHPKKMGDRSFTLAEIVSASSVDELVDRAADMTLNSLIYEKPSAYLSKFNSILSISSEEVLRLWPSFVELKARRDIGIHNSWVVNDVYVRKVQEVGITPLELGAHAVPGFDYLAKAIDDAASLVEAVVEALSEKWIKKPQ